VILVSDSQLAYWRYLPYPNFPEYLLNLLAEGTYPQYLKEGEEFIEREGLRYHPSHEAALLEILKINIYLQSD